jgi:hypothetical protein
MDLIDVSPGPTGNQPEYTVSELSGAVKRVIEGEFGLVRVRGEVGRVSRPASGHLSLDHKDSRAAGSGDPSSQRSLGVDDDEVDGLLLAEGDHPGPQGRAIGSGQESGKGRDSVVDFCRSDS